MKNTFYNMFYIFIFGSVAGWLIEGAFTLLKRKELINHSALVIGPFNIAYGICAVLLSLILYEFKDSKALKIFLISFIGGTIVEYIMSFGMELIVGFTAWDYSRYFLNINGRVCLLYSIYWGVLGVIWIKYCYPYIIKIIDKIDYKIGKKLIIIMTIFLVLDAILTISAVNRAYAKDKGIRAQNTYERLLDKTFNKAYLKNMFNNHWKQKTVD